MKPSRHAPSATTKAAVFLTIHLAKTIYFLQVVKKDQTHPTGPHRLLLSSIVIINRSLNAKFIHQLFGHASHHCILQIGKLGIYTVLKKSTPKLSHPCFACVIDKGPRFHRRPNVSIENINTGTHFHLDFIFFNKAYFQEFTSPLTIVDATTSHLFGYTTISKRPPLQLIKTFIQFSLHYDCKSSIFRVDEGGGLTRSEDFIQLCIYYEVIVETNEGCASSINGIVERTHQTINNMIHIQLLSRGHNN